MDEKPKILIVEDEKPMANALVLKLNKSGFVAQAVYDGQAAIKALGENTYDLVLLDLMMPNVDGFAVLEHVKQQKVKTKIIVSTNLSQESDMARAEELGADGYFVKSDTPIGKVVEHVEMALGNTSD